ncbi:hypothetical protein EJ419_06295 [Alloscardovia theropitheci]|uniref:Uncharacterized protein n=1 Tax=Alloscardovia theropitheci TaxID=2496842 RepID=A0A4V6N6W1_9BIFI|nr:hypothetical protein [Alloscardovia theropitheci]TCD53859.1 hypothetical protein EJ419_06295 [Alloscardovia theropitheci]
MANLSDANGTMTVISHNPSTAFMFVNEYRKQAGDWFYNTIISDTIEAATTRDGATVITVSFTGTGRWAYSENIAWTFNILTDKEYRDKIDPMILAVLEQAPISVTYDYADFEPGCEILYTQKVTVTYDNGTISTDVIEHNQYDYTLDNLKTYIDDNMYGLESFRDDLATGNITKFSEYPLNAHEYERFTAIMNDDNRKRKFMTLVDKHAVDGIDYTWDNWLTMFYEEFKTDILTC